MSSYLLAQPVNQYRHVSFVSTSTAPAPFRAPAHKHAHHLHSIPPREKSTRTLIIDHMLWVHGRTRFAQARAELGMTDRTGGPTSLNYAHRSRPEGYEEDDEEGSEGEQLSSLKPRSHPLNGDEDSEQQRTRRQDLSLARGLRLRAEGLEKVITAMLDQPPPIHPLTDDDVMPSQAMNLKELHRLPNGVRLRLALGTIINDLFARQSVHPPYRHTHHHHHHHHHTTNDHSPVVGSPADLPDVLRTLAPVSGAFVPRYLHQKQLTIQSPSFPDFQYPQSSPSPAFQPFHPTLPRPNQRTKELYFSGSDPSTANCPPALRCPRHLHTGCEICIEAKSSLRTGPSRRSGVGTSRMASSSSSSSSTWRNTVHFGLSISGFQEGTGIGSGLLRPSIRGNALRRRTALDSSTTTTSTAAASNNNNNNNRRSSSSPNSTTPNNGNEDESTTGAGNTKLSKLLPRFLRLSALVAAELGREARGEEVDDEESEDGRGEGGGGGGGGEDVEAGVSSTSPNTVPTSTGGRSPTLGRSHPINPIHPFQSQSQSQNPTTITSSSSPQTQARRERKRMYENALRPSREWYMLLAGLLTRAVLEGYLTAGWSGLSAVQCLLLIGLGINENLYTMMARRRRRGTGRRGRGRGGNEDDWVNKDYYRDEGDGEEDDDYGDEDDEGGSGGEDGGGGDEDAEYSALDPDELPDLMQAMKILFPSLRDSSFGVKDLAEEEYELEMLERLRRFYDIPTSTPDCSIHMEGLAWQYPAEPVERAAVRYCEAIAKWRGKPELETYKKKPPSRSSLSVPLNLNETNVSATTTASGTGTGTGTAGPSHPPSPGGGPMTIESLVHSNPTTPSSHLGISGVGGIGKVKRKPLIDVYFPPTTTSGGGRIQVPTTTTTTPSSATTTVVGVPGVVSGGGGPWIPITRGNRNGGGGGGGLKRFREVDDVGRVVEEVKRMF